MNGPTLRALFADALFQVLDNKVFRILVVVTFAFVAFTFLIGFTQDEVVVLWGWRRFSNQGFIDFLAGMSGQQPGQFDAGDLEVQKLVVQSMQDLIVQGLAGTVGMMLAISATGFFVPRMLEKGAADTLFSKPVSRLLLLLSRYVAGLLFVGILATCLIGGMHVGFSIVSGYSDPGFLWGIVTMTYVFALIHGVTMLVGVVTRSTVASILVTLMFFMGNGCIHQGWTLKEYFEWTSEREEAIETAETSEGGPDDESDEDAAEEERSAGETLLRWFFRGLDAAHYTLPKTGDAALISSMLREAVVGLGPAYLDPDTGLEIDELAAGYRAESTPAPLSRGVPSGLDPPFGEVRFSAARDREGGPDRMVLYRRDRREIPYREDRVRSERLSDAQEALAAAIADDPALTLGEEIRWTVDDRQAWRVDWTTVPAEGATRFSAFVFYGMPEWIYLLVFELPLEGSDLAELQEYSLDVLDEVSLDSEAIQVNPGIWYQEQFSWTNPKLRFNAWFSIGSSLAFVIGVLGLSWWRLRRIDF
jgi:ABC-type transport system involved in multi-copper enzyme maturation permease subunit